MKKSKSYLDIVLLIVLSLLVIAVIYWDFSDHLSVSINDFILIGLVIFTIRITFYKSAKGQWILVLLILATLPGVLTINYNFNGYSSRTVAHVGGLNFNPLSFFLLLLFLGIDRRNVITLFYGSQEERNVKSEKLKQFYYDKFKKCTDNEFDDALLMFDDYPEEARSALNKLTAEIRSGEFVREY